MKCNAMSEVYTCLLDMNMQMTESMTRSLCTACGKYDSMLSIDFIARVMGEVGWTHE
jgi:hypothetical protein